MATLHGITIQTDSDNIFTLVPDEKARERGVKVYQIKATGEMIKRFLLKTKPGDNTEMAKSKRFVSYEAMMDYIINGTYNKFWFWAHDYPKTQEEFADICYNRGN